MLKKSVCIIGSGMAGAGVGALLSHSGKYEVDVYEKHHQLGGRFMACTPREGYNLDIGIHGITQSNVGPIGELLEKVNSKDKVTWNVFENPVTVYDRNHGWVKYPEEMEKMGFSDEDLMQIMNFYQQTLSIPEEDVEKFNDTTLTDQIAKYIDNGRVQNLFAFMAALAMCIRPSQVPVGEWSIVERGISEKRAVGYPIGGTRVIPEALLNVVKENSGTITTRTEIKKIVVEDGKATGIEFEDGTVKNYDIVISNAGSIADIELVGKDNYKDQAYVEKLESYEYSKQAVAVRVGLKSEFIDKDKDIVMYIGNDEDVALTLDACGDYDKLPETLGAVMIPIISNMDPSSCPEGKQSLTIGTYCADLGPISDERKREWEQTALNTAELIWPGFKDQVEWVDSSFPEDFERIFGEKGNPIGIGQVVGQVGKNRPPLLDPEIKNLYHCSADTGHKGVGGELAANCAMSLFEILEG